MTQCGEGEEMEWHITAMPDHRQVTRMALSHDDAVALCERLNREARAFHALRPVEETACFEDLFWRYAGKPPKDAA